MSSFILMCIRYMHISQQSERWPVLQSRFAQLLIQLDRVSASKGSAQSTEVQCIGHSQAIPKLCAVQEPDVLHAGAQVPWNCGINSLSINSSLRQRLLLAFPPGFHSLC